MTEALQFLIMGALGWTALQAIVLTIWQRSSMQKIEMVFATLFLFVVSVILWTVDLGPTPLWMAYLTRTCWGYSLLLCTITHVNVARRWWHDRSGAV